MPMGVDTKAKAAVKKPAAHPNTWVFFEGDFARYNDVKLGLMTHALHYGTAVFEGIRAYWNAQKNQLFLLEPAAHYDRMKRSANVMRMTLPYSTEAIVLSSDGHVSEGSAENVFMLKDGAFITPPVTDDILEGVTRQLLIKVIGEELNLPVLERSIDRTELYTCDELLLCGTGAQISPVIEVDRRPVGNGRVGEFTQELQNIYFGAVRGDTPKYKDWTIPVY